MFGILQKNVSESFDLAETFQRVTQIYNINDVTKERREYLSKTIEKFGYIPYPHYKVLEEMSESEIIYSLVKILENEGVYKNFKLQTFQNNSILYRKKIKNSDWFKKEGHNIKLISLSALKGSKSSEQPASFISWIAQLISLPMGNKSLNILPDTIYLIPFFKREFGCAYLPMSSEVSKHLEDEKLLKFFGLDAKAQVKMFISLAQLAGHPVIYDILPQTSRFSKIVLSYPACARWINIPKLQNEYTRALSEIINSIKAKNQFSNEEIENAKNLVLQGKDNSNPDFKNEIFNLINQKFNDAKKSIMLKATTKTSQEAIVKEVLDIIEKTNGKKAAKEEDILNHIDIINALMKKGYWTLPGGAWCSAFVPIYEKMNETGEYPLFKHYNYKNEDVTKFANLDCQTPYYFTYFENGKLNDKVVNFFIQYVSNLQKEYNFDGFRVDHIDHVVDDLSEQNGSPISYRTPRKVLGKMNSQIKKNVPYFATLAEYMLWDNYYLEYHKDMNFDVLWGNDIVSQSSKTPKQIIEDNKVLENYNTKNGKDNMLSILKTYNNQDGEFEAIDRYPGQLGETGAIFKWFKYKFIPGGAYANRPSLYIDGDESFTAVGIEHVIGCEDSLKRSNNWNFYEKFNAINYFSQHSKILTFGKAKLIEENKDGLACWEINSMFGSYLCITNYKNPSEKMEIKDQNGVPHIETVYGNPIYNNKINLGNRKLKSYLNFEYDDSKKLLLVEKPLENLIAGEITMEILNPAEFKVYGFEE